MPYTSIMEDAGEEMLSILCIAEAAYLVIEHRARLPGTLASRPDQPGEIPHG